MTRRSHLRATRSDLRSQDKTQNRSPGRQVACLTARFRLCGTSPYIGVPCLIGGSGNAIGFKRTVKDFGTARLRLNVDAKLLIEQAAAAKGQTVSDFAVSTLVRSAEEVLERLERRRLSDRDRDRFLEMLDSSDEPNPALKRAARDYKRARAR